MGGRRAPPHTRRSASDSTLEQAPPMSQTQESWERLGHYLTLEPLPSGEQHPWGTKRPASDSVTFKVPGTGS